MTEKIDIMTYALAGPHEVMGLVAAKGYSKVRGAGLFAKDGSREKAIEDCKASIRKQAENLGANAVYGARITYDESRDEKGPTGDYFSMVITGTAVRVSSE